MKLYLALGREGGGRMQAVATSGARRFLVSYELQMHRDGELDVVVKRLKDALADEKARRGEA